MNQQANPSTPAERSQAAVALDDLIRRHLRVNDPSDPVAISTALRERYVDEQQALDQEAAGLPFFKVTRIDTHCPAETSTSVELHQAREDVSRDLDALLGNALLKDVYPELRGWSQHIRQAVIDGVNAARFALDPWQRDQALATRRLLGDYARVVRFVGALSPGLSAAYRSLANSLDEVSSVILVTIGEALAQAGYGGGRFLLQAPASELQVRRDAVINALRNLVGSRYTALGQSEWAYGQHALRQVMKYLDNSGIVELRALFQENHVANALDELVHWATRGSAEDLRALGATAHLTLGRFRRLLLITRNVPEPPAPPFSAYLDAIHSFLDAFSSGAGYRLLYIARPAIAHYGLYGADGPDKASQRMLRITAHRGELAQALDCNLGCGCTSDSVRCQIMLDKVLHDIDRAIDLYVMGTDFEGEDTAEQRAAAYGVVIDCMIDFADNVDNNCTLDETLCDVLDKLRKELWWENYSLEAFKGIAGALQLMHQELCIQRDAEAQWENLLHTMAPSCFSWETTLQDMQTNCAVLPPNEAKSQAADASGILVPTQDLVECAICRVTEQMDIPNQTNDCGDLEIGYPETLEHGTAMVAGTVDKSLDGPHTQPWSKSSQPYFISRQYQAMGKGSFYIILECAPTTSKGKYECMNILETLGVAKQDAKIAIETPNIIIAENMLEDQAKKFVADLAKVGAVVKIARRITFGGVESSKESKAEQLQESHNGQKDPNATTNKRTTVRKASKPDTES